MLHNPYKLIKIGYVITWIQDLLLHNEQVPGDDAVFGLIYYLYRVMYLSLSPITSIQVYKDKRSTYIHVDTSLALETTTMSRGRYRR